jgi:hypothetical protein
MRRHVFLALLFIGLWFARDHLFGFTHNLVANPPLQGTALAQGNAVGTAGIRLIEPDELATIIRTSTGGTITAFVLSPHGAIGRAVSDACRSGHRFFITLDGRSFVRRSNDAAIAAYNGAGCVAHLSPSALHMKLVYASGRAFLSDENFSRGYVIEDDNTSDRDVLAATLRGRPTYTTTFSTIKSHSLDIEAGAIAQARSPLIVESESFGPNNPVANELERLAGRIPIRLLVANAEYRTHYSEQRYLRDLAARGIDVRVTRATDKMAVFDDIFFAGSTNSTAGVDDQIDWGLIGRDGNIANAMRQRFERNWADAQALR